LFRSPESRGGRSAEKRSGACEAPVGRAVARHVRRLRGALRPMTQQYTSRNNVTISMHGGRSVPIVSQTEIDPMKTALSLMLALATTTAFTEPPPVPKPPGPGGSCSHGYIRRARHAAGCCGRHREAEQRHLPVGMDCVGLLLLAKWTRAALALALRFVFSVGGPSPCRAGHRRVVCVARAGATSKRAAGRASGSSAAPAVKREAEEDWR